LAFLTKKKKQKMDSRKFKYFCNPYNSIRKNDYLHFFGTLYEPIRIIIDFINDQNSCHKKLPENCQDWG
jgi:hypothetical protein